MLYIVANVTKNTVLAKKAKVARSFFERLKGLIGKRYMEPDEALIFYHCSSVHTFFMRFPIDVVFLNKQMEVIKFYKSFFPCKISRVVLNSYMAIEFCAGTLDKTYTAIGDVLKIEGYKNADLSNASFEAAT
ncbi:DUF192 domain-containing protein [bacterium]|nr:MAG: DUF192 domain-containing protein [bacterium]